MMYVGIAPPRPNSRRLVVVEQRGAEEEYGRDHEERQECRRDTLELAGPAEKEEEHRRGQKRHDHQRRERPGGMDVVGPCELEGAAQRWAEAEPLDVRGRHREPDEREPGDRRQHEEAVQKRRREKDDVANRGRDEDRPAVTPTVAAAGPRPRASDGQNRRR